MRRAESVRLGIIYLRLARDAFKDAGAKRTTARVRLALTSAGGALRHAELAPIREQRLEADAEVARVRAIIDGGTPRYDEMDAEIVETATCGTCGRSWNDARISELTPTPSARCPFEYAHRATA